LSSNINIAILKLSPFTSEWASNHPVSSEAEDCVRVNTDGEWEVVDCSAEPYLALCEVDYPQPSPG